MGNEGHRPPPQKQGQTKGGGFVLDIVTMGAVIDLHLLVYTYVYVHACNTYTHVYVYVCDGGIRFKDIVPNVIVCNVKIAQMGNLFGAGF